MIPFFKITFRHPFECLPPAVPPTFPVQLTKRKQEAAIAATIAAAASPTTTETQISAFSDATGDFERLGWRMLLLRQSVRHHDFWGIGDKNEKYVFRILVTKQLHFGFHKKCSDLIFSFFPSKHIDSDARVIFSFF